MPDSSGADDAPSLSPWEVLDFAAYVKERNVTFKREGDLALDPATRRYFDRLETCQHREMSELRTSKSPQSS